MRRMPRLLFQRETFLIAALGNPALKAGSNKVTHMKRTGFRQDPKRPQSLAGS